MSKYSQEEINQILLSKKLSDFYFAILQVKTDDFSEEELQLLYSSMTDDEIEKMLTEIADFSTNKNHITLDDIVTNDIPEVLRKAFFRMVQPRRFGVLTMIDDEVYDLGTSKLGVLEEEEIICFENLTKYYDDTNARLIYVTTAERPFLKENIVDLDVDDLTNADMYIFDHLHNAYRGDLKEEFVAVAKSKSDIKGAKQKEF